MYSIVYLKVVIIIRFYRRMISTILKKFNYVEQIFEYIEICMDK